MFYSIKLNLLPWSCNLMRVSLSLLNKLSLLQFFNAILFVRVRLSFAWSSLVFCNKYFSNNVRDVSNLNLNSPKKFANMMMASDWDFELWCVWSEDVLEKTVFRWQRNWSNSILWLSSTLLELDLCSPISYTLQRNWLGQHRKDQQTNR